MIVPIIRGRTVAIEEGGENQQRFLERQLQLEFAHDSAQSPPFPIPIETVITAYSMAADAGVFTVTGTAASLEYGHEVAADVGSYVVTGTDASFRKGFTLTAASGAFTVTGTAATVQATRKITADAGSVVVTGTAAAVYRGRTMTASSGSFTVTGTDASLRTARTISAVAGSYAVSGTTATLIRGRVMAATSGSYSVSGTAATLTKTDTYYVDATGGSDSNNGLSTGAAWQTLSKVNGFAFNPGDVVRFKRGETFVGQLVVDINGTSVKRIRWDAYGSGARPLIDRTSSTTTPAIYFDNGSYHTMANINAQGGVNVLLSEHGSENLTFEDMDLSGSFASGVINVGRNVIYRRVVSHDNGTDEFDHGYYMSAQSGIQASYTFEDCVSYGNASGGFHCFLSGSGTFDRCNAYENGNWGFLVSNPVASTTNLIRYCRAWKNGSAGIEAQGIPSTGVVRVYNCTMVDNIAGFYEAGHGFYEESSNASATVEVKNCIMAFNAAEDMKYSIAVVASNDLLWRVDGNDTLNAQGTGFTVTEFQALLPLAGMVCQDPLFVDRASGDLHIQGMSPAKNAGTSLSLTVDFDGETVPRGSAPDIGFDEWQLAYTMSVTAGSYVWTGTAATLSRTFNGYTIAADVGAFTVTGTAATIRATRRMAASSASVAVSGTAASVVRGLKVAASAGAYTVTGIAATVRRTGYLAASSGSYAVAGTAANVRATRTLSAGATSYLVTGQSVTLARGKFLQTDVGAFSFTGTAAVLKATRRVSAVAGSVVVTGTAAAVTRGPRSIAALAGAYSVAGQTATLGFVRVVQAQSGAFVWTGGAVNVLAVRRIPATTGTYLVTGTETRILLSRLKAVGRIEPATIAAGRSAVERRATGHPNVTKIDSGGSAEVERIQP